MRFYQTPLFFGGIIVILIGITVTTVIGIRDSIESALLIFPYFLFGGSIMVVLDRALRRFKIIGEKPNMKIYMSPLSLAGIFYILSGLFITAAMILGGYPTYLFIIAPLVGIAILQIDYFVRKSKLSFMLKFSIQIVCAIISLIVVFLFFTGRL